MLPYYLFAFCVAAVATAAPQKEAQRRAITAAPTATGVLPKATYIGASSQGIEAFRGIPFAVPPVNTDRLKPPASLTVPLGTVQATGKPDGCPQQLFATKSTGLTAEVTKLLKDVPLLQSNQTSSEDCLTLNIERPAGTKPGDKLPVVFWIFGGGFEFGSTNTYSGANIIRTSVAQGTPILYVATNYRLGGWGFLGGKEIKEAGSSNLGLLDQRLALQWVADNIAKFGGDPSKVTIWGESAGSVSVFDQMALYNGNHTYKGKNLFRAAVMDSGSIIPAHPVDGARAQGVYDSVVKAGGCSGASDTLACLRNLDYDTFSAAAKSVPGVFSYNSVALSYLPRPDGKVLVDSPDVLIRAGRYAKVPFIIGDQEDEGTLFSLSQSNITTSDALVNYLSKVVFPGVPLARVTALVDTYPNDPSAGSPYRTGILNQLYPQFKRLASILGDISFILSRRAFLDASRVYHPDVPTWSYLSSYLYGTPILGTFHVSDVLYAFGFLPGVPTASIMSYYISFFTTMDPNTNKKHSLPPWPKWADCDDHQLLNFRQLDNGLVTDDFRNETYTFYIDPANKLLF